MSVELPIEAFYKKLCVHREVKQKGTEKFITRQKRKRKDETEGGKMKRAINENILMAKHVETQGRVIPWKCTFPKVKVQINKTRIFNKFLLTFKYSKKWHI